MGANCILPFFFITNYTTLFPFQECNCDDTINNPTPSKFLGSTHCHSLSVLSPSMAPNNVVVTLDNISLLEPNKFQEKQKAAIPKHFSWVLLLKAHRFLASIPLLALRLRSTLGSIKKRIASSSPNEEDPKYRGRLYRCIKAFLAISVAALVVEIVAYSKQWDLSMVNPWEVHENLVHWSYMAWLDFRVGYVAPLITALSKFCIALFLIQSIDRFVQCLGWFWIKCNNLKPVVQWELYDVEDGSSFPMVLVQIPMCNEKEVP